MGLSVFVVATELPVLQPLILYHARTETFFDGYA